MVDPQSLNSYAYARNNPIGNIDPDGESWKTFGQGVASPFVYAYNHPLQTSGIVAVSATTAFVAPVAVAVGGVALGGYAVGNSLYNAYNTSDSDTRDYYLGQATVFGGLTALGIKSAGGLDSSPNALPDSALCVRGGLCTPDRFIAGNGESLINGRLTNISVRSAPNLSVSELSQGLKNSKVGVTTVGAIRQAGGNVVPSKGGGPYHATMSGITPEQASRLFQILDNISRLLSKLK